MCSLPCLSVLYGAIMCYNELLRHSAAQSTLQGINFSTCRSGFVYPFPKWATLPISFVYFKRCIYLPKQSIFLFLSFNHSQKQKAGKTSGLAWCYEFCTDVHKINAIFIIALIIWTFTERILTLIRKLIWILMKVSLLLCEYNLYFISAHFTI